MHAHAPEQPFAPELEAVIVAAERQLRALAGENPLDAGPLAQALADAATAAIAFPSPPSHKLNSADSSRPVLHSPASCSPASNGPPAAAARPSTTSTKRSPAPHG